MKQPSILATWTGLAALIFTITARAEFPVIQSIEVGPTNLVVTARVPPGHARVLLESRDCLRTSAWVPVAVQRVGGQGGEITFRLPRTTGFAFFRVRADVAEPLPASFYAGPNSFDPQPVSAFPACGGAGWVCRSTLSTIRPVLSSFPRPPGHR